MVVDSYAPRLPSGVGARPNVAAVRYLAFLARVSGRVQHKLYPLCLQAPQRLINEWTCIEATGLGEGKNSDGPDLRHLSREHHLQCTLGTRFPPGFSRCVKHCKKDLVSKRQPLRPKYGSSRSLPVHFSNFRPQSHTLGKRLPGRPCDSCQHSEAILLLL